jgi:predicted amidohydrolase
MQCLWVATAQFEHASGNKEYNLGRIRELSGQAAAAGAEVIAFHECSITGYSFARSLSKMQLLELSERIPDGPSVRQLIAWARELDICILAGLFERTAEDQIHKAYVCVNGEGLLASFRKLHPFINPNILPGDQYIVFHIKGWTCSILICYDNNIIENVRAASLLGAEILFMPHVTMCTPSPRPGAGFVDPALWENRATDPDALRKEFDGPKGREWLMKWLPARAYDNAVFAVFSNAIGMDGEQLKNGCSMILDPFGDIIAECRRLGDDFVIAELNPEKIRLAGGYRYKRARRPELYKSILGQPNESHQEVAWMSDKVFPSPQ